MKLINALKVKLSPENVNYKMCFIISIVTIVVGAIATFVAHPQILRLVIRYLLVLKPGRFLRNKHEMKQRFVYRLFLWNVTNPNEITAGTAKPKLQEIGPYVFNQFKQKVETNDNESEDTYSFDLWTGYYFDRQLSAPLTGDETLTLLNPVLVGSLMKVMLERPNFINVAIESMDLIFKNPSSIFLTISGMDFIENGFEIDCNRTEFSAKAACAEMRRNKILKVMNAEKTLLRFRWFDRLNDSIQARYTMKRGSSNAKDIGYVTAINDATLLKIFKDDDRCNVINGTDKSIFPPFQKKREIIWTYASNICRSLALRYIYTENVRRIKTAFKSPLFTDSLMHPTCNCNKYSGCGYSGTIDMYACTGLFVSGSSPHYYLAESTVQESVEGMHPNARLHESGTHLDLLSGVPINALERGQLNILLKRIPEYPIFSTIADDVWLPFLWYEEQFILADADATFIRFVKAVIRITLVLAYLIFVVGIVAFLVTVGLFIHQHVSVKPEAKK